MRRLGLCTSLMLFSPALPLVAAQEETKAEEPGPPKTIAEFTEGLRAFSGLLDYWWDAKKGRVLLAVPAPDEAGNCGEYIYVTGLSSGLGSNPIGLDRGQVGPSRLVRLRRIGTRFLIEQQNLGYRALSDNLREREAVTQSFAPSVLFGAEVLAEDPDGRFLVDLRQFLLRDTHAVQAKLQAQSEGTYELDASRSAIAPRDLLAFPDNLEFDVLATYAGTSPGRDLRNTVPDAAAFTLRLHHSLVRLPDDGYRPREAHPDVGYMAVGFQDYAAPLAAPMARRWIQRHRLEKVDPDAARSYAIDPIVYYVDSGAPARVRDALLDGARWWSRAFEAAGFVDAYRVETLPEGVHPLDVRYNVIHWVHRSTRGWSYGGGVRDPRTGEIIKGNVLLGSLRVRQDRRLFEGLSDARLSDRGGPDDPVELALARIRQLAAHEVGHTLGLVHNFAASTYGGRASVMDYPAPWVQVGEDGELDFSQAYGVGLGAWDVHTIRYGYSQFAPGVDETEALAAIVREGREAGLTFLSDADARPASAAQPLANLWDNGANPLEGLRESYAVRAIALRKFGPHNLAAGQPLAHLQEVLVPVYLHHRYQAEAAAKLLGGVLYDYEVWDGQEARGQRPVAPALQREALELLLDGLEPSFLELRPSLRALLLPRPLGSSRNREMFLGSTDPTFDPVSVAATAADHLLRAVLQPARLSRVAAQNRDDADSPSVDEVLGRMIARVFAADTDATPGRRVLRHAVQDVAATRMMETLRAVGSSGTVRNATRAALVRLDQDLRDSGDQGTRLRADIQRFLDRGLSPETLRVPVLDMPPGSPIGCACEGG